MIWTGGVIVGDDTATVDDATTGDDGLLESTDMEDAPGKVERTKSGEVASASCKDLVLTGVDIKDGSGVGEGETLFLLVSGCSPEILVPQFEKSIGSNIYL